MKISYELSVEFLLKISLNNLVTKRSSTSAITYGSKEESQCSQTPTCTPERIASSAAAGYLIVIDRNKLDSCSKKEISEALFNLILNRAG